MSEEVLQAERERAIHLLRSGHPVPEVAEILGRSERWVRKWRKRFEQKGWKGLKSCSRRPRHLTCQLPDRVRQAILETRSELEAEAARGEGLKFIGSPAIRTRLREKGIKPLPSRRTIERVLHQAGMTRPRQSSRAKEPAYPRLRPHQPHTLVQVDIYPRYLRGGQPVACFNGLDVVSRRPVCRASPRRRSRDAADFLCHLWATVGVPRYTQVDNEACFSGGFSHPCVLGRVVRLALMAGTELVFSPVRHPRSQGAVERFHRTYARHVWEDTLLADIAQVNEQAERFVQRYIRRPHPQLGERTPAQVHRSRPAPPLPAHFPDLSAPLPKRLPLYAGRVHFIRKVNEAGQVKVLNRAWAVPGAAVGQGVWVTLTLTPQGASLEVFDAAPDASRRRRLVRHPFPVKEPVRPWPRASSRVSRSLTALFARLGNRLQAPIAALLPARCPGGSPAC